MSDAGTRHPMPYPGMRPFQEQEWDLLFGQDVAIDQLLERLGNARFVAVMGESGCGKSSIVKAGLIPALVGRGRLSSSPDSSWHIALCRPARAPIHNLAKQLVQAGLGDGGDPVHVESVLREDSHGLLKIVKGPALAPGKQVLVVIDQFEELFRYQAERSNPDLMERDEAVLFVKLLLAAAKEEAPIYVVLTMRSEYLGDCSSFSGLAEAVSAGTYLLPKMEREQIEDAIVEPLQLFEQSIENKLLQHLLNETESAQQDGLPLLQHALRRTWEAWRRAGNPKTPLGMSHFRLARQETGQLDIATHLNVHLDEIFESLSSAQQKTAETTFKLLGEFDHKMRLVRRPTGFATIKAVTGLNSDKELLDVLNAFRDEARGRSFLRPRAGRDEELLAGTELVDISHEALLRRWHRCAKWIQQESKNAEEYRRLSALANRFGDSRGVLRGLQLQAARRWWFQDARPTRAWSERYSAGEYDWQRTLKYLQKSERYRNAWRSVKVGGILALVLVAVYGAYSGYERKLSDQQSAAIMRIAVERESADAFRRHEADRYTAELTEQLKQLDQEKQKLALSKRDLQRANARLEDQNLSLEVRQRSAENALKAKANALALAQQAQKQKDATHAKLVELERRLERDLSEATTQAALNNAQQYRFSARAGGDLLPALQAVDDYVRKTHSLPRDAAQKLNKALLNSFILYGVEQKEPVLGVSVREDQSPPLSVLTRQGRDHVGDAPSKELLQRLAVSDGGGHVVFGRYGGSIELETTSVWQHVHTYAIAGLGFSTDDKWLATASTAGDVKVWDVPDLLRAGSQPKNLLRGNWSLFKAKTGLVFDIIFHHVKGYYPADHIALSVDRERAVPKAVAYTTESGDLWIWSPHQGQRMAHLHDSKLHLAPGPYGEYSAVATNPADQKIWAGTTYGVVGELDQGVFVPRDGGSRVQNGVTSLAWDKDGTFLAVGRRDGVISVFRRTSGSSIQEFVTLTAHDSSITALSWKKSGNRLMLASGAFGGGALLWDLSLDQDTRELMTKLAQLLQSEANSPEHRLAIGESDSNAEDYRRLMDLFRQRANRLQQLPSYASSVAP